MSRPPVTVGADWDDEAQVWVISSDDVPGLHLEADRYDDIEGKVSAGVSDLAEHDPEIARLSGRPLGISATRHVA